MTTNPSISYTIAMPRPHSHLFHVSVEVRGVSGALDLALPVWTPGSYMVRDYARHVQEFGAADGAGRPLPWRKLDKTSWRVEAGAADTVTVSYKVYAFDLTVRTSHLDGSHGYFNPATLCVYLPGRTAEPLAVRVEPPPGWSVATGLELTETDGSSWSFVAQDYDELVDSPFECGTHRLLRFEVDGILHEIALWGRGNENEGQIVADTRRIVETARDMFGALPYRRYLFIVHLADGRGGGLEHRNSVSMLVDRWTFQPRTAYERYLGLTAHEFFHVWNVKRIRPAPLGPFDYSRENYTRQLWTIEGVTSYYTELLLRRAGLITPERYLELLAEKILSLQSQPGRLVQSLAQSSFDAWIKLYRPDENSANSAISYYLKGELVALLLDLEIRQRTGGACSLDDVLIHLHEAFPPEGPGFAEEDGFLRAVETITGLPGAFDSFFERSIAGTEELDYAQALGYAGLLLDWGYGSGGLAWLGLRTKNDHGRTVVAVSYAGGPAEAAGVYAGDELLALDGHRIDEARLEARLAERSPGDTVTLSLFRRDELHHVPVTLAPAPPNRLAIVPDTEATDEQIGLYVAWLGVGG
ncbi:MAG TPA: PDZ domain-containing protein [Roseiflexaceae bacterium]|nr:PDZ domain-containing protein [Roseiflexaceae bacterium]